MIGAINTGVPNTLFANGCTMSDLIAQLAAAARNHGAFVSAVAHLTNQWVQDGLITGQQKGAIQSAAARCPEFSRTTGVIAKSKGLTATSTLFH